MTIHAPVLVELVKLGARTIQLFPAFCRVVGKDRQAVHDLAEELHQREQFHLEQLAKSEAIKAAKKLKKKVLK